MRKTRSRLIKEINEAIHRYEIAYSIDKTPYFQGALNALYSVLLYSEEIDKELYLEKIKTQ